MASSRKRTEDEPRKLVFGVHSICRACKGRGTKPGKPKEMCRSCDGSGIEERKEQPDGQG